MAACTDEVLAPEDSKSADAVHEGDVSCLRTADFADIEGSEGEPNDDRAHRDTELVDELLPPVDGGVIAWRFLFAAFTMEALVWGRFQGKYTHAEADISP